MFFKKKMPRWIAELEDLVWLQSNFELMLEIYGEEFFQRELPIRPRDEHMELDRSDPVKSIRWRSISLCWEPWPMS